MIGDRPYEPDGGPYEAGVAVGDDDDRLSVRAVEALDGFYASRTDMVAAARYDRDEDADREQQYEQQAGRA